MTALRDGVRDSDKMAASILHRLGKGRPAERVDIIVALLTGNGFCNHSIIQGRPAEYILGLLL